jgi:uncharacterized protein YndB with AHSA1/START domain
MTKSKAEDETEIRVERQTVVKAPIERVYAALTDPSLFPTWGPERVDGKIAPGERPILDFGASGKAAIYVVAVEPPSFFAYRWVQGVTDPKVLLGDPLKGPNTLVEFHLETIESGTRVRVVESGRVPSHLVSPAGAEQIGKGWELMLSGLPRHFAGGSELSDVIEGEVVVRAPRDQVYAALTHPERWWAQKVEGTLAPGERPVLDFGPFGKAAIYVTAAEPSGYLAYRWVQGVDDPARRLEDPRNNPSTLVEFRLEETPQGTHVHQRESGFAGLPGDNVLSHYKRAHQGWGIILGMLEMHVTKR